MKLINRNIWLAWIILICFTTGQVMVFAHQHRFETSQSGNCAGRNHSASQHIVSEKCSICDMMQHTHMAIFNDSLPYLPVTFCETPYINQHNYCGIALILSAGRSPPKGHCFI